MNYPTTTETREMQVEIWESLALNKNVPLERAIKYAQQAENARQNLAARELGIEKPGRRWPKA